MKIKSFSAIVALSLGSGIIANAALIHAGGNVTLVSTTVFEGGSAAAASDGNTASFPNGQVYTDAPGGDNSDYFALRDPIVLDLNLGATFDLSGVAFWNRGFGNGNGTTSFQVVFSTDSTFGNADDSTEFAFTPANEGGQQQNFSLGTVVSGVQFVRVTIDGNDYGNSPGGDRVAFTEFQFDAIPEPSSAALISLGVMAFALRRKK